MTKTAVITGAASGIGLRTMERLLAEGWDVWGFDLSEGALGELDAKLGAGSRYRWQRCDVTDETSLATAFAAVERESGSVEALICCAGVTVTGSLADLTVAEADLMMDVNFKGPWLTARHAVPLLRKKGNMADPTRIVIIGSVGGIRPKVGTGFYSATKAAVHVITGILAVEHAEDGITTNAIAPASVDTPMQAKARLEARGGFKPSGVSPLGRIAKTDDVADVALFLLSDAAKYVNGVVLPVDGGTRAAFVKN